MAEAQVRKESDEYFHIAKLNQQIVEQAIKATRNFITSEKPVAELLRLEKSEIPKVLREMAASPEKTAVRVGHDPGGSFIGRGDVYSLKLYYKGTQHILALIVDEKSTQLAYAKGSETEVAELLVQKGKTLAYEKFA